ncbi:MAG: FAD-dependent oxidoreductase, partial [Kiritimatiellaeota bacterium]|nr:FAD-dependent oxidoreductase [Kiritimatiellota bacterium]
MNSSTRVVWGFLIGLGVASAQPFAGLVMDDDEAVYTGDWGDKAKQTPLVGNSYHHDFNKGQGKKSACFTPDISVAGVYEVRLLYVAFSNRATHVPVLIRCADGEKQVFVNQREEPPVLGVFRFAAGKAGSVTISSADADGFVIVDGLQLKPVGFAIPERAQPALKPVAKSAPAAQPLPPVQLKPAAAAEVDGQSFDLVVIGGTPAGCACAVRAAREGCTVLLVNHTAHLGGMLANGLFQWDALYGGPRAPLFSELLGNIETHYRATFGEKSRDFQSVRFTQTHYPIGIVEPRIAEREFGRLIAGEKNLTVLLQHDPVVARREGALLRGLTLREYGSTKDISVSAALFADATYEGDLAALAKVSYRVGREARAEFNEPHAGVVFANIAPGPAPADAVAHRLNIHPYSSKQGTIDPASPFTADGAVQAYNLRPMVTRNPTNRVLLAKPPPNYRREEFLHYDRKGIAAHEGPNRKAMMNTPILPGENHAYPEADWPTREKIFQRHTEFCLGLIWFLQNDESVSASQRAKFREWDNGNLPYEMYVREARRIVGRHVYTEHDNSLAPGLGRTPIQPDSIAITDWYMDSHSCTTNSRPGFRYDGKLILTEESRPGQIPYRSLLPKGLDNLLVPLCLSATHVAWGAVRLEPVAMEVGDAAGFAAALAKQQRVTPAALDSDLLVRTLCKSGFLVS